MDIKQLNSKIKLIRTNGAKLDALIQEAALGCIEHAAEHGDVRPANQLWEAMQFKKAPSNRGLRPLIKKAFAASSSIQKSPIKSGIKTCSYTSSTLSALNSKKPHQIGD